MQDLQDRIRALLIDTAERLRGASIPGEPAMRLERLAAQVDQPCEVAVVGRVKAGKSTFINALLGGGDAHPAPEPGADRGEAGEQRALAAAEDSLVHNPPVTD